MDRQTPPAYEFGVFSLDLAEHRLLRHGQPVPLTPKVFELLRVLVQRAGHLVSKEQLMKEVWGNSFVEESNLNRGISVLRKALRESADERYIETVPKVGYRFVAPVVERANEAHPATASRANPRTGGDPESSMTGTASRTLPVWAGGSLSPVRAFGIAAAALLIIGALAFAVLGRGRHQRAAAPTTPVHRQLTFTGKEVTPTVSPDGERIAYVSTEPQRRVMTRALAGGPSTTVFSAPEAGWLRWSPDGAELLFWARGEGRDGMYIAPRSGAVRRIARGPFVACWSPDSSAIAIAWFQARKLRIVDRLGAELGTLNLAGINGWIWDLDWSAAAGRLLFVANDEQRRPAIWTIRPDGTGQNKVLTADSEIRAARWSPSGNDIYYSRLVNQTVSIYKAPADSDPDAGAEGDGPLLSGLDTDGAFALSADGARLVYARSPYHSNLWIVEADAATGLATNRQLTQGTSLVERPRVSPDGQWIVFNMGYESRAELYTIPTAGGAPTQLTFLDAFSVGGVWSKDGRSVAFASTRGGKARVWMVSADGGPPRPVSSGDMSDTTFDLTWSPGDRILYQQAGNRNFYVLEPVTGQEHHLIGDSSVGWAASPVYSPDGETIALSWNRPPDPGVWIVEPSSDRQALIHKAVSPSDSNPWPIGWSPDGTSILAIDGIRAAIRGVSVSTGETLTKAKILSLPAGGGPPTVLVSLPFEEVGSVAMFPDGRRFVCAVYASHSDVWLVEHFDPAATSQLALLSPWPGRETSRD
ncbi:MAG TPA: winged helix-turn-helix domain-containing protein [Vicinamibacterales bacterium]|nr:winged helix-turn-helix domain-containing protein [Vicinamibacterales bacterium]